MDPTHRSDREAPDVVQQGNQAWWTRSTMSYDWNARVALPKFSLEWFDEVDRRFIDAARLFATSQVPFDRIIPFERLAGKRVLEIGCGMGLHSELMVKAGAEVTAIDFSPVSVEATTRRFAAKGILGDIRQCDAERLPFTNEAFDFIWSWGVIHHSARTGRIVREIARVARPSGEARVMVYNRNAPAVVLNVIKDQVLRGGVFKRSIEESYFQCSDGYSARFYPQEQFEDLFRAFFDDVSSILCGQEADAILLPKVFRSLVRPFLSERYLRRAQSRRGSFVFITAAEPR